MAANPMTQFEVYRIGPEIKINQIDISFTNASLFMIISALSILLIFNLGSSKKNIIPTKIQLLAELSYSFISKMISDTAGSKAKPYFSFIFSLFMFVLFCNMFGMLPYSFTVTSHIIVTFFLAALIFIGVIVARLYTRSSKEVSFVRTGFGGEKVILNGGAIVLPVLHEIIPVNMNTLRLEVKRAADQALITRDRMRVDVMAEFYVRVKPTGESIATAAQTLGRKTMSPQELKDLVEGKFVDSLRAVAAEMAMEELHEKRVDFVQKVQQVVSEDLSKNGF